jgi:hypothetical protein
LFALDLKKDAADLLKAVPQLAEVVALLRPALAESEAGTLFDSLSQDAADFDETEIVTFIGDLPRPASPTTPEW